MSRTETTAWPESLWETLSPAAVPGADGLRRRLREVLPAPVEPYKMTYEEFLAWADEDTLAELAVMKGRRQCV